MRISITVNQSYCSVLIISTFKLGFPNECAAVDSGLCASIPIGRPSPTIALLPPQLAVQIPDSVDDQRLFINCQPTVSDIVVFLSKSPRASVWFYIYTVRERPRPTREAFISFTFGRPAHYG